MSLLPALAPWQQRAYTQATEAIDAGRFGHATLIVGPALIGKRVLAEHLAPEGEGWLILSDLAEHLGLRSRDQLLDWIAGAGLRVLGRLDTAPCHPKAHDGRDRLHAARAQEVTSLWRLGVAPGHE